MIIAYHAIFTTYGTWLPNDPRGSYSKHIYTQNSRSWARSTTAGRAPQPDRSALRRFRAAVMPRLSRPPYYIKPRRGQSLLLAFGRFVAAVGHRSCLRDHERSRPFPGASVQVPNRVPGQSTQGCCHEATGPSRHPLDTRQWKVFIEDNDTLAGGEYVDANPEAAGLKPQHWDFVMPLAALVKEPGTVLLDS